MYLLTWRFQEILNRRLAGLKVMTLYDMDSFKTDEKPAELQEHLEAAGKIVREQMDEFFKWLEGKESDPAYTGN